MMETLRREAHRLEADLEVSGEPVCPVNDALVMIVDLLLYGKLSDENWFGKRQRTYRVTAT